MLTRVRNWLMARFKLILTEASTGRFSVFVTYGWLESTSIEAVLTKLLEPESWDKPR
jgi:hypothetical protein